MESSSPRWRRDRGIGSKGLSSEAQEQPRAPLGPLKTVALVCFVGFILLLLFVWGGKHPSLPKGGFNKSLGIFSNTGSPCRHFVSSLSAWVLESKVFHLYGFLLKCPDQNKCQLKETLLQIPVLAIVPGSYQDLLFAFGAVGFLSAGCGAGEHPRGEVSLGRAVQHFLQCVHGERAPGGEQLILRIGRREKRERHQERTVAALFLHGVCPHIYIYICIWMWR